MEKRRKENGRVLSQKEIAPQIFDMWIGTGLAAQARPGQFIGVYPRDKSTLLPRPISICQADRERQALRIVYRVAGRGTEEFSHYKEGDEIAILGTLGNGFPLEAAEGKRVLLMGGGIGIPPLLAVAEALSGTLGEAGADIRTVLGYRDSGLFLKEDFRRYGAVYVAAEDGSVGIRGNVMDAVAAENLAADVIYACGPMPMLRAIKGYAAQQGIDAYISLEEHMACGVGACLGCVVKTKEINRHSHVNNARICTEGPVFEAKEVEI